MTMEEYHHYFSSLEGYPRPYYFKSRFLNLLTRFINMMKPLPERLHMQGTNKLESLKNCLNSFLELTIIGHQDLHPHDLVKSDKNLEKLYTKLQPYSQNYRKHICIVYVNAVDRQEASMEDVNEAMKHISTDFLKRYPELRVVIIACKTSTDMPTTEADVLRSKINEIAIRTATHTNVVIDTLIDDNLHPGLADLISNILEKDITDGFNEIFTFLHRFIRKETRQVQEDLNVLESEDVTKAIKCLLGNELAFVDAWRTKKDKDISLLDIILDTIFDNICVASIPMFGMKFNLPDWVCHELLDEKDFSKELREAVSENTLYHLKGFEKHVETLETEMRQGSIGNDAARNETKHGFIVYMLQKDLQLPVKEAEITLSLMSKIAVVMKKMMFETRGYLMQSNFAEEAMNIVHRELTSDEIKPELKDSILSTEGVYGMGVIYGQLEIHLKQDLKDEEIKVAGKAVSDIFRQFKFPHSYLIKSIKERPSLLAGFYFEQGDTVKSNFPDNKILFRKGSLGCFLHDKAGCPYAVTCAHVVDPHVKTHHDIHVNKGHMTLKLGDSTPDMIIYGSQQDCDFSLLDFAAIKVIKEAHPMCNFMLKDEHGNNKAARFETECSAKLVGSHVYKYGAQTSLTNGIIAANEYITCGKNSEQVIVVESLPELADDIGPLVPRNGENSLPPSQVSNAGSTTSSAKSDENDVIDLLNSSDKLQGNEIKCIGYDSSLLQEHMAAVDSTAHPESLHSDVVILNQGSQSRQESSNIYATPLCDAGQSIQTFQSESSDSPKPYPGLTIQACSDNIPQTLGPGHTIKSIQSRAETEGSPDHRNSELLYDRNPNEGTISSGDSGAVVCGPFAVKGDSGAVVCRRDLATDKIVAISMITAGEMTFKDHVTVKIEANDTKCVSIRLDMAATKLSEKCGIPFHIK